MDQRLSIRDQLDQGIRVLDFEMAAITGDWICATEDERDGRDVKVAKDGRDEKQEMELTEWHEKKKTGMMGTIAVAPGGAAPSATASNCTCEHHLTLKGHCFSCCPFIVSHGNLEQSVTLDFGCKYMYIHPNPHNPQPLHHNPRPLHPTNRIHLPTTTAMHPQPLVVWHVYPYFTPLPGVRCLLIPSPAFALSLRPFSTTHPHPPSPTLTHPHPPSPTATHLPPPTFRYLPRRPVRHRRRLGASTPFRDRHPVLNRHPRQPVSVLRGHRRPPPRYRSTRPRVEPRPVDAVGGITIYDQPVSYAGRDAGGQ